MLQRHHQQAGLNWRKAWAELVEQRKQEPDSADAQYKSPPGRQPVPTEPRH